MTIPASFDRTALPYWDARAPRWNIAPPLAPGAEDVRFYEECAAAAREPSRALDALLLGVTAPIAAMRWPAPTRLVALDWSEGMLRHVWPRDRLPHGAQALRGDWREIPLRDACIDFAIGVEPARVALLLSESRRAARARGTPLRDRSLRCSRLRLGRAVSAARHAPRALSAIPGAASAGRN